jgi:serine protease Do
MRPSTIANLAVPPATLVVSVLAALTFPPAAAPWQAGPGSEAGQAARALKAEFRQDFRSHHYDPEILLPWGYQGELFQSTKGLDISFRAGQEQSWQDTGLIPLFGLRGDFEVMVSFEILNAERPKRGDGVGLVLFIGNAPEPRATNAVSLAHLLLSDGNTVFMADRQRRVQGKWTHERKSVPVNGKAGKLRIERQGGRVRFSVGERDRSEFATLTEVDFGKSDLLGFHILGGTGGSPTALDLRLLEFTVRAESLPGWSDMRERPQAAPIQQLNAEQLGDVEARVQKLNARLAASVVRIRDPKRKTDGFSGVILGASGEIFTCAHHDLAPKTRVIVTLANGQEVMGTVLGSTTQRVSTDMRFPGDDVGLVVLDEKGDWPDVPLRRAAGLKSGELCVSLGQPNVHRAGQRPLLRLGRFLSLDQRGRPRNTCRGQAGDSGGPLFDLDGRVIGVLTAMESLTRGINLGCPVDGFLELRDRLRAGELVQLEKDWPERIERHNDTGGAWLPTEAYTKTLNAARGSTVEILADGKTVALGIIVDPDGWVLTKATELIGPRGHRNLFCRLADGRQRDARMVARSAPHDLALVRVAATGLPAVTWGPADDLGVGTVVVSLGTAPGTLQPGVIGAVRVSNPPSKGYLPTAVRPGPKDASGVTFTDFLPAHRQVDDLRELIRPGDLITHLDNTATPSLEDFVRVRDRRIAAAESFAGDRIKLTVKRDRKTHEVFVPLVDGPTPVLAVWLQVPWNLRRSGIPVVFSHDGGIPPHRCGGPVVNRFGQVIAVNVARVDQVQTFAIPADVVQRVIGELRQQASE